MDTELQTALYHRLVLPTLALQIGTFADLDELLVPLLYEWGQEWGRA